MADKERADTDHYGPSDYYEAISHTGRRCGHWHLKEQDARECLSERQGIPVERIEHTVVGDTIHLEQTGASAPNAPA